jgi:hypothetical protein
MHMCRLRLENTTLVEALGEAEERSQTQDALLLSLQTDLSATRDGMAASNDTVHALSAQLSKESAEW